ncbi:MAG: alpha/beta fold hydrolase [Pseudomonadota bacterium]
MRAILIAVFIGIVAAAPTRADVSELYGRADSIWDAQVSPGGSHVALGCGTAGVRAVCVYDLQSGGQPQIVYPGDEVRVEWYYWASDTYLVTNIAKMERLQTSSGLQELDVRRAIAYNIDTKKSVTLMRDEGGWDDLTDVAALCENDPGKIVMQLLFRVEEEAALGSRLFRRNPGLRTQLYDVTLKTGRSKARPQRQKSVVQSILGADCEPFVNVIYNDQRKQFSVEMADTKRVVFERQDMETMPLWVVGTAADNQSLIVDVDDVGAFGLHTLSLSDGTLAPLVYDGVEVGNLGVLEDRYTNSMIGFSATNDLREHYYIDGSLHELQGMVEDALPGQVVRILTFTHDRLLFTLVAEGIGAPAQYFLFDAEAGELSPLGAVAEHLSDRPVPPVQAMTYAARDGLEIEAYLTLPAGRKLEEGPFPTVIMPHGGPEARDTAAFDWWSQAYADAGYAVIRPNFRGSAGYGQAFRDAGFGEFGGKMIDDIVDAISWAETARIADPRGVCVAGGSYGGYAALMTALKAPDKVGCVIAVAPVTNIFQHMGRFEPDTWSHRYWARYAGGDVYAEDAAKRAISPMDRTSAFSMPVLLMHGKNDAVVLPRQSSRFASAWGRRPGLRFVEMDGQDHFLSSTKARYAVLRESLALLQSSHPARNQPQ